MQASQMFWHHVEYNNGQKINKLRSAIEDSYLHSGKNGSQQQNPQ